MLTNPEIALCVAVVHPCCVMDSARTCTVSSLTIFHHFKTQICFSLYFLLHFSGTLLYEYSLQLILCILLLCVLSVSEE